MADDTEKATVVDVTAEASKTVEDESEIVNKANDFSEFWEDINEDEKIVDGYYVSDKKFLGFFYTFKGNFGLYEFECESNDSLDYFRLNCNDLGDINEHLTY